MPDVIIRPIDLEKDAQSLAEMWNESDAQWPGGWTDGVPYTAEMMLEWEREARFTAAFVAEEGGKIVGYSSLMDGHDGHEGEGYLAVLNVHPEYQKRSIGRKLIQATIEQSVKEGWQRQTLGTWSANFKAVPTYKKTGHYWTPDTSVWMQCFVPGALQLSLAKPFFERHNWYSCYVRELEQEQDDQRWEGLKVFTQRWEADGESLTIWIDREARAPVAIETDGLQVAAIAEDIEPLAGSKVSLRWRVVNKGSQPVRVFFHALGDKGLEMDHRDAFDVPAGETVERTSQVKVAPDAARSKDDGTAPAIRSIIRLNEDEVELYSGLRVRKPLSLDTAPTETSVFPGTESTVKLQLHSELDRPIDAMLFLTPPNGLDVDWVHKSISVPPKAHVTVPVTVVPSAEGVYALPVRVEAPNDKIEPLSETVTLFAHEAGGLLVQRQAKTVRIETDTLRVVVAAKEAKVTVTHKTTQRKIAEMRPTLGPPYWPSEFQGKEFEVSVKEGAGRVRVHLTAEAKHYKGLHLLSTYSLSSTGLGTLCCSLENRGGKAVSKTIRLNVGTAEREAEMVTLPLRSGVVHSSASAYPTAFEDAPRQPSAYAEPWFAWEQGGAIGGLGWDATAAKIEHGWHASLDSQELPVDAGERSAEFSTVLYCGTGTWRDARSALLRWAKKRPNERKELTVRPPALARVDPQILVTTSEHVEGSLIIDNTANRPSSGEVTLTSADGLSLEPASVPVLELNRSTGIERKVRMTIPEGRLGVYAGEVRLQLDRYDVAKHFYVLRVGTEGPVAVEEGERADHAVWTIDSGVSQFEVAPGFGPSMISWMSEGENQLHSCFPEPEGMSWLYPCFGGLHALLLPSGSWAWEGYLHRERISAEPVESVDGSGVRWQGVRLHTRPEKKELHDLSVELDYLTVARSNLLKMVYRVRNLRGAEQKAIAGIRLSGALGTTPEKLSMRGEGIHHRPTPWGTWFERRDWGALVNEESGRTLLLISNNNVVSLQDMGTAGRWIGSSEELRLSGHQTHERVYYCVLADSFMEARRYLVLRDHI